MKKLLLLASSAFMFASMFTAPAQGCDDANYFFSMMGANGTTVADIDGTIKEQFCNNLAVEKALYN